MMDSLKVRLILAVTGFAFITGALAGALLYYALPQFFPAGYFGIVFFFLVAESLVVYYVAANAPKASPKKMVNVYMLAKTAKILASLAFIVIAYAATGKENIRNFVIVFVAFYALYLFFETFLFSKIERELKSK